MHVYVGIMERVIKPICTNRRSPILSHICCLCRLYVVMAYSETIIFSTVDIEWSCPVYYIYITAPREHI